MESKKIYFQHLDVIRFIAAFIVGLAHTYEAKVGWFGEISLIKNSFLGNYINQFIRNLGIGVDVFFLLSGFLITYILLEEKKQYGNINIGKFILRRTLRIWPLYYFLIIIAPFLVEWLQSTPEPNYLANALFLGNFNLIQTKLWVFPFAHFWSICVEEHFYLFWPFLIAFIPRKYLLSFFTILLLGSIFFRMYVFSNTSEPWFALYLHTLSRIDVLVIGAIGAWYYSQKPFVFVLKRSYRWALFLLLIVALSIEGVSAWDSMFSAMFKKYFYISIIAILLLDYNFNPYFKHLLKPKSIIHYFGKVSYGIYMYGNMLNLFVVKKVMWVYKMDRAWIFFLITIFLSLLIPIISYEVLEKPFLRIAKRFRRVQTDR